MTTRCAFLVLDGVLDCSHNTFVPALCMAYNDIWSSPEFQNYPFGQRPVYIPVLIFFWGGGYDAVCVGDFRNFTLRQSVLLDAPVAPPPNCRRRYVQTPLTQRHFGSIQHFGYPDDVRKEGNCVQAAGSRNGRAGIMVDDDDDDDNDNNNNKSTKHFLCEITLRVS